MPHRVQSSASVLVFTQRFSATPRGARLARRLALFRLDAWGIPYGSEASEAAAQIVAELAANAVTHGRVAGRDFELRLTREAHVLQIEVSDARGERRPPLAPQRPATEEESGRGLLLVAALASAWGVAERAVGKTVWARLHVAAGAVTEGPLVEDRHGGFPGGARTGFLMRRT